MIGDLHGCLDQLQDKLNSASFEPERVIACLPSAIWSTPIPLGCLKLLQEPWFSVLGNHDQMLLDALADPGMGRSQSFLFHSLNGGEWAATMILQQDPILLELAQLMAALPHVLVVGEGAQRFHVVHAQLLADLNPPPVLRCRS